MNKGRNMDTQEINQNYIAYDKQLDDKQLFSLNPMYKSSLRYPVNHAAV
jgi:hypothetical protein